MAANAIVQMKTRMNGPRISLLWTMRPKLRKPTPTFQPGYAYSSDPNAPWVDVRYLKTWAASASG